MDANGLPWDKRIHSGGKTRSVATDTWNKKRGVSPEEVAAVETELLGERAQPCDPVEAALLEVLDEQVPPSPSIFAPATPLAVTFPQLISKITERQVGPQGPDFICALQNVLTNHGITQLTELSDRNDLLPQIDQELDSQWQSLQ